VTQRVVPIGPSHDGLRRGTFEVALEANCNSVVNSLMDVQKYLPSSVFAENYGHFEDPAEVELYERMARETDPAKQRALMREFERYVLDTQAHGMMVTYWNRIVPLRSYVKGWKIGPSHYVNQDLADVWLDR
jgi:peptide/nickel transport system substrate-binding protein